MNIRKLSEELNSLIDMIDNDYCYIATVYDISSGQVVRLDSQKFNTFNEAKKFKQDNLSNIRQVNITRISTFDEALNTQSRLVFQVKQDETGYFLYNDEESYVLYPVDKRKSSITEAIKEFLTDEYYMDKDIRGSSIKWLDFNEIECVGSVEITLYFE